MPIEIKELHIKVKIEEENKDFQQSTVDSKLLLAVLKTEIIKECTTKILEILKDREQR